MIFIKNGTINTITNGIIKGDILVENKNGKFEFEKAKDSWKIKGYKDVTLSNDAVNFCL